MVLDAKCPSGPLTKKWDKHRFDIKLVNPANKRKFDVLVVGSGLAGASAAASLALPGAGSFFGPKIYTLTGGTLTGTGQVGINSGFLGQNGPNLIQDALVEGSFETGIRCAWRSSTRAGRSTTRRTARCARRSRSAPTCSRRWHSGTRRT